MNQENVMVVVDDAHKDPTYARIQGTYVMLLNDEATRSANTIGTMEASGDVLKVYDLTKIMELMDQAGLLAMCEVAKRPGALT